MISTNPNRRTIRPARLEAPAHLFTIGQVVRLKGGFRTLFRQGEIYRITGTLPPRDESFQYRIRSDDERHERVATQESLEPVNTSQPGSSATLIERTFGHG